VRATFSTMTVFEVPECPIGRVGQSMSSFTLWRHFVVQSKTILV